MSQSFLRCLEVMIEIFLLSGAGFIGRKAKILSDSALNGTMEILLNLSVPASIIYASRSLHFNSDTIRNSLMMILLTALGYVLIIGITLLLCKTLIMNRSIHPMIIGIPAFKNISFLGFPLCITLLGEESIFYAVFSMAIWNLLMWSFGIYLYSGGKEFQLKKLLTNSALISSVIMLLLSAFRVNFPDIIWTTLKAGNDTCTPLSLFVIGIMLADADLLRILRRPIYLLTTSFTLLLCPALMLGLVLLFRPAQEVASVLLVLSCLPSATLNPVVAKRYGGNGEEMSAAVLHSMVISLASMPLLISALLHIIGYE